MRSGNPRSGRALAGLAGCLIVVILLGAVALGWGTGTLLGRQLVASAPTLMPPATRTLAAPAGTPEPQAERAAPAMATPSQVPSPTATVGLDLPVPVGIEQDAVPATAALLLDSLMDAEYPARDYYADAQRFSPNPTIERTVRPPSPSLGDVRVFVTDSGQAAAELVHVSDYAYWWVDRTLTLSEKKLQNAARRFEADHYPTLISTFGEEWRPGMDNDPRFNVLHLASFLDSSEIGFFDSGDEYPRAVNESSNEAEIIYLNMSYLTVGEPLYFGTLAHEFLHLVQWHQDSNETTWLDEGLAQLGESVLGLETVDTHLDWIEKPATQLNWWDYSEDGVYANYGASYLFALYLWERLGDKAITALAQHPANGLESVAEVLQDYAPQTSLEALLSSWAAANWLDGRSEDASFGYEHLALPQPAPAAALKTLPFETSKQVPQFGVHYIDVSVGEPLTVTFAGDTLTPLLAVPPFAGEALWFAPPVDNLSAHLTGAFDLTQLRTATLSFWAWYDLETDWDFAYVSVSADGGSSWDVLTPRHGIDGAYGPALGGRSVNVPGNVSGWVNETLNLSRYAGREVLVRIEVLTDATERHGGFALDEIGIVELGARSGAEREDGRWTASGFVRSGWQLPQRWSVQAIENEAPYRVQTLALDDLNRGQWRLDGSSRGLTLVIMPLTPFTSEPGSYWLRLER